MGDLVIGAFSTMDWLRCEAFVVSVRKYCPKTRCMAVGIFVEETARKLLEHGFELFEHDWLLDYTMLYIHPNNARWWPIADALRRTRADRVFLSDTRDVVLQGDIFKHVPDRGILVPMEGMKFSESEINAQWLEFFFQQTYKKTSIEEVQDWDVSCCGTLLGRMTDLRWYTYQMVRQLSIMLKGLTRVSDQAIHNWLMNQVDPARFHRTDQDGEIMATMSATADDVDYESVKNHVVLHQYEQRPKVRKEVYRQLGLSEDPQRWSKKSTNLNLAEAYGWTVWAI